MSIVTVHNQEKFGEYKLIDPLRIGEFFSKGWTLVGEISYKSTSQLIIGKGKKLEKERVEIRDLHRIPLLKLPEYVDPLETVKGIKDPDTLLGLLQGIITKLATPLESDAPSDSYARSVGKGLEERLEILLVGCLKESSSSHSQEERTQRKEDETSC